MKAIQHIPLVMMIFSLLIVSCSKDEIVDEGLSSAEVNMSTYDFLKSHSRQMFDTTLLIIDKAGMKDLINSSGTFFVPNDYAIENYLSLKQAEVRRTDERKNFTLDSLLNYSPQMLRDSMGMYFFPEKITRDVLSRNGTEYQSNGVRLSISLEERNQYLVDGIISTYPQYIYFSKIIGEKDIVNADYSHDDPSGNDKLQDRKDVCQTTGIITTTGVVHVLANSHVWTFKVNQ